MTRSARGWEKFWSALTGEWMLRRGCPNGGTIIFLRSLQVSATIYAVALLLHTGSYGQWSWAFWTCIDSGQVKKDLTSNLQWLGAIFAAVYTALYARFASQWSYLAGVCNQMREALVRTAEPDRDHLVMWRAGFIEDALDLHLATKRMFRPFLLRMLDMPPVAAKFDNYTVSGEKERARLEARLRKRGGHLPRRAAEALLTQELPVLGLTETDQKDLRDLCTALCDKYVFQDLTEGDARRVALVIAQASVLQGVPCAQAAPVVKQRANAVRTEADGFWKDRQAAGRALDSAATVLAEAAHPSGFLGKFKIWLAKYQGA
jgi:hypothetical protein